MLEEARAFEVQGRHDAAERAARRGLEAAPHDAALTRALARAVEARGDAEAARALRERAGVLDPPPPDPPQLPVSASSRDVLIVLLRPDSGHADPDRVPRDWPDTVVAEALQRRLRVRLPEATLAYFEPESVADARRWLPRTSPRAAISLRVERAYCDSTIKDGSFAVGWLRVAAERPGPARDAPEVVREVVAEPRLPGGCRREAVSRALERVLELEQVQDALTAPALPPGLRSPVVQQAGWSRAAIRALFPDLGRRIQEEIDAARRWIASGHLAKAAETLLRAAHIDPDDPDVRAYLSEVDATLLLASEIAPDAAEPGVLDPRFTPAQRAAVESRLREERRRREDLLAALAVLDEDVQVPGPRTLRALRPVEIRDADAFGPALARARAGTAIEARAAYAPDGSLLSVYFFPESAALPVLREEDTSGDARPDRWIGYDQGVRSEIWEDARGAGQPGVRVVFASGGRELERIELDSDADGRLDHVFRYADGALAGESRDEDGDGRLDTFDRFDAAGQLVLREEDLDGDGRIDVRSVFRAGRLVRREISDPAHAPDGT
jgi:tetratricopeptide (TPR) repeat protein